MQVKVYTCSSSSSHLHSPWTPIRKLKIRPKTSLKPLTLSNSLKTSSFNHEFQEEEKLKLILNNSSAQEIVSLPVVIRHSGAVSRYFWDGDDLKLASVDGVNAFSLRDFSLDIGGGVRKLSRICGSAVRDFFLPREVSNNYLGYVKWKFLHRVFSSALQVLATQAMFRAIGIGKSRSLASAAALNWLLKEGLGRLSRCIYTATLASAFDTNLKRVRFSTSVLFSLSIGVELLTPVFPEYFLLLATIANIAKQICLACYLATGTTVHQSFAIADNLGEVSAKAQIQTVCFDNLGLMLAAILNILFKNNQRLQAGLPFVVYPIFSAIDLFGIYQGLKHVHLQTLTKDRLEIIMNTWINLGYVPSPAEVSKEEGIDLFWSKGRELLPIRIGCLNPKRQIPKLSMMTMRSLNDKDFYFICMESVTKGFNKIGDHGVLLCLREGAGTSDVIMGLLQASYIRKSLLLNRISWENDFEGCDFWESNIRLWLNLKEESKQNAQVNVAVLNEQMSRLGWACKNILLSTMEQARYSFVAN
ncbi:protein root UVB sensitive 4 [Olea europaea var. sylvestris]|uniref:protein root UVB sensitive 4 n=1 Tax=Olea europaea var. sylvestris TaxID=158386 RepID=UPI000C1D52F7|nr:protein root UVB sensitive 4 [Olea europaea var. sylvestris]